MAGAAELVTGKQKQSLDCGNMWRPCMCRQVVTSVNCAVNIVHPRMHTKYTRLVIIKVLNRIRSSFKFFLFMFILIILGYRNREEINSMITSGESFSALFVVTSPTTRTICRNTSTPNTLYKIPSVVSIVRSCVPRRMH